MNILTHFIDRECDLIKYEIWPYFSTCTRFSSIRHNPHLSFLSCLAGPRFLSITYTIFIIYLHFLWKVPLKTYLMCTLIRSHGLPARTEDFPNLRISSAVLSVEGTLKCSDRTNRALQTSLLTSYWMLSPFFLDYPAFPCFMPDDLSLVSHWLQ